MIELRGCSKTYESQNGQAPVVALDGVDIFVVACPKDITMYRDAVKTTGHEDRLQVKDLIELIEEAMAAE